MIIITKAPESTAHVENFKQVHITGPQLSGCGVVADNDRNKVEPEKKAKAREAALCTDSLELH